MNMKKYLGLLVVVLMSVGLLTACGSSSGSNPAAGATVETAGSSGAWTINMKGGDGGTGGVGGFWNMTTYQVQGVKLLHAGTAAATVSVPNYNPPFDSGSKACVVSTNTTASATFSDPGSGKLYVVPTYGSLFMGTGGGSATDPAKVCTSLKVNAGVTLTVGLNTDSDGVSNYDEAVLIFANDVMIAGTLKTADLTTPGGTADTRHGLPGLNIDMGALNIDAQQVFVTGSIITKGLNGSSQRGGDGGYININAHNYFSNLGTIDNSGGNSTSADGGIAGYFSYFGEVYLLVHVNTGTGPQTGSTNNGGGVFINKGKLLANGGTGANGGDAAELDFRANSDVFNTGTISANGGKGTSGAGGNVNYVTYIYSEYGSISNSGTISQIGGNGITGGGYTAGAYLSAGDAGYSGDIVNSGPILADAGSATVSGAGSGGAHITMYAHGAIKTSGRLSANGGDSMGSNTGGQGGYLLIQNYVPFNYGNNQYFYPPTPSEAMPVRPIQISGNIYLNGGSSQSGAGGQANSFYVTQAASNAAAKSNTGIQLLGYASANLSGGNGTSLIGGDAYDMQIYTYNDVTNVGDYSPAGPIQNQLAITMKGGNSTGSSNGGEGGYIDWESSGYSSGGGVSTLTNSGKIDVSGGAGGSGNGGESNKIYWYGQDGVTNTGALVMRGGNSVGGTGGYGAYNGLAIYSSGNITNSGAIDTTGGSGATGGNGSWWDTGSPFGNWVQIYAGGKVTNTGSINCPGGAGTSTNGNGGGIDIMSEVGGTSNTGALNVSPGAGTGSAGLKGQAWIDWVQVK